MNRIIWGRSEPEFLEEELQVAGLIMSTLGNWHVSVLLLKSQLQLLLHFASLVSLGHLVISDNALEVDFSSDYVSGGHQVVQIHVLDERLDIGLLLDLFLAHSLGHLSRVPFDSCHQSVGELSLLGTFFTSLDHDSLLAGLSSSQKHTHSSVFQELHHCSINIFNIYSLSLSIIDIIAPETRSL